MPNDDYMKALNDRYYGRPLSEEEAAEIRGSVPSALDQLEDFDFVLLLAQAMNDPQSRATLRAEARSVHQTSILPVANPEEFDSPGGHQLCIGVDEKGRHWFYQPLVGYGRESESGSGVVGTLPEPGLKGAAKRVIRGTVTEFGYGGLEQGAEEISQLLGRGGLEAEEERLGVAGPVGAAAVGGIAFFQIAAGLRGGNPKGAYKALRKNRAAVVGAVERVAGKKVADRLGRMLGQKRLPTDINEVIKVFDEAGSVVQGAAPATVRSLDAAYPTLAPTGARVKDIGTSFLRGGGKKAAAAVVPLAGIVGGMEVYEHVTGEPEEPKKGTTEEQFARAVEKRKAAQIGLAQEDVRKHDKLLMGAATDNDKAAALRAIRSMNAGPPPELVQATARDFAAAYAERRLQNTRRRAMMDKGWAPGVFHKMVMEEMQKLSGGKDAVIVPPRGPTPDNRAVRKATAVLAGIPHEEPED